MKLLKKLKMQEIVLENLRCSMTVGELKDQISNAFDDLKLVSKSKSEMKKEIAQRFDNLKV